MMYSAVKYKKFVSQRRFGVELETSNTLTKAKVKSVLKTLSEYASLVTKYQLSGDNPAWHVKDDATCGPMGRLGPKGVEIASFVGKGINDLQHIADVAEGLHRAGCRVNNNCGLHVHAEAKDLTTAQVGVLIAHWIKIEPIISMSMPLSRFDNVYCRTLRKNDIFDSAAFNRTLRWNGEDIWQMFKPDNLNFYENEDRRVTLNLVNFARAIQFDSTYRKTLELRWPEGTLDGRDVRCWVRLFLIFIDTCKDRSMPSNLLVASLDDVLTYFGLNHDKDSFHVFSEGLHDTKSWFLERLIQYGSSEASMALHGHPVHNTPGDTIKDAKKILNLMWSPLKKYA